jgi:predicted anti-sigma-YlaC factor YlaD
MAHLNPDDWLDLADGSRPEAAAPHLAACESCRRQVAELRTLLAEVSRVAVPEPSPLFWDQLSARISEAVAADQVPGRGRWRMGEWSWGLASVLCVAVAVGAVVVTLRSPAKPVGTTQPAAVATAQASSATPIAALDDPSLSLLVELAAELEWDAAASGVAAVASGADVALGDLTNDERAELRRLLDEAMAGAGA